MMHYFVERLRFIDSFGSLLRNQFSVLNVPKTLSIVVLFAFNICGLNVIYAI
jgi:hypothetical protein